MISFLFIICFLHSLYYGRESPLRYGAISTLKDAHPVECGYAVCLGLLHNVGSLVGSSFLLRISALLTNTCASVGTIFTDDARNAFADKLIVQAGEHALDFVGARSIP